MWIAGVNLGRSSGNLDAMFGDTVGIDFFESIYAIRFEHEPVDKKGI